MANKTDPYTKPKNPDFRNKNSRVRTKEKKIELLKESEKQSSRLDTDKLSFKKAFRHYRDKKGAGKTFSWRGDSYTTNYKEEAAKSPTSKRDKDVKKPVYSWVSSATKPPEGKAVEANIAKSAKMEAGKDISADKRTRMIDTMGDRTIKANTATEKAADGLMDKGINFIKKNPDLALLLIPGVGVGGWLARKGAVTLGKTGLKFLKKKYGNRGVERGQKLLTHMKKIGYDKNQGDMARIQKANVKKYSRGAQTDKSPGPDKSKLTEGTLIDKVRKTISKKTKTPVKTAGKTPVKPTVTEPGKKQVKPVKKEVKTGEKYIDPTSQRKITQKTATKGQKRINKVAKDAWDKFGAADDKGAMKFISNKGLSPQDAAQARDVFNGIRSMPAYARVKMMKIMPSKKGGQVITKARGGQAYKNVVKRSMGGAVGVGKALRGYGAVSRKKGGKIY